MIEMDKFIKYFKTVNQFDRANGADYTVHAPGAVTYRWTILESHLSSPGLAHGGAISGFMDCLLGLTAITATIVDDQLVATVEFKMNFIKPTP